MAVNINVQGTLYPAVADRPTHDEEYGKGGYRSVADHTARLNIPTGLLTEGMLVHQNSDGVIWKRVGSGWLVNGNVSDGSITEDKLDSNAVTAPKIQNGAITFDKLATGSVISGKIAADVVTNSNLRNGAATEFNYDIIHNGNSSTSATAIDVTATTGTTDAIIFLSIVNNGASPSTYKFGPANSTIVGDDIYDVGVSVITVGAAERGLVTVHTNDVGVLDWISSAVVDTELTIVSHSR